MTRFYKLALYVVGIFLIVIVCILLCLNNSSDMKYVEATSVHDAYFIYKNVDCLTAGEGQELSQFLPQEATDIWMSREGREGQTPLVE